MADTSEFIVKVLVQLVRDCLLECLVRLRGAAKIVSTASYKSMFSSKAHNNRHVRLQQMMWSCRHERVHPLA